MQPFHGLAQFGKAIQSQQSRSGVTAGAAQTGAGGNLLSQGNPQRRGAIGRVQQPSALDTPGCPARPAMRPGTDQLNPVGCPAQTAAHRTSRVYHQSQARNPSGRLPATSKNRLSLAGAYTSNPRSVVLNCSAIVTPNPKNQMNFFFILPLKVAQRKPCSMRIIKGERIGSPSGVF